MIQVSPIPAFKDNYIWLLISSDRKSASAVDPGDAAPILNYLQHHHIQLKEILVTHHHWDHVNGILPLLEHYPSIPVYGPAQEAVSGVNTPVKEGNTVELESIETSFKILDIPGHTLGHIAYYNNEALFCGDTLFSGGCGRIFEGTPEMMYESLNKLKALNEEVKVYCGHEYTFNNLKFAQNVEPGNSDLQQRFNQIKAIHNQGKPSLPSVMAIEKRTNPFLRCTEPSLAKSVAAQFKLDKDDPVSIFGALRKWKDSF